MAGDTPKPPPRKRAPRKPTAPDNVVPITGRRTPQSGRKVTPPNRRGKEASATVIAQAERIAQATNLRRAGLTFTRIAELLAKSTDIVTPRGYNRASAYRDVRQGLDRIIEEPARELLELELSRLDDMQAIYWQQVRQGDQKAGKLVLDIMRQRSRYIGLDSPIKHQLYGPEGEQAASAVDLSDAEQVHEAAIAEMEKLLDNLGSRRTDDAQDG